MDFGTRVLCVRYMYMVVCFCFEGYGDHRDLHVLTHSFPTRRSSDLVYQRPVRAPEQAVSVRGHEGIVKGPRVGVERRVGGMADHGQLNPDAADRKSTRLNSSH